MNRLSNADRMLMPSRDDAIAFLMDLAWRIVNRHQVTTDGYPAYRYAIQYAFDRNVDHAAFIKIFGDLRPLNAK